MFASFKQNRRSVLFRQSASEWREDHQKERSSELDHSDQLAQLSSMIHIVVRVFSKVRDSDCLELIGDMDDKLKMRTLKRVLLYKVIGEKKENKTPKVAMVIWKAGLTENDATRKLSFKKFT